MALVTGTELAAVLNLTYASDEATFDQVADAADTVLSSLLTDVDHDAHPADREAALGIAQEMYQARTAVGGSPAGFDYASPSPYRLSVWLTRRGVSLYAGCLDMGGWVG